jgi:hypothetical protein
VIQKNWNDYEFDFSFISLHLKFKILLCLQKNLSSITEEDLRTIFAEEEVNLY